jgi:DNA polymerase-3 subunit delta
MWTSKRLARALQQLGHALLDMRKQTELADVIAHRAFLSLAVSARRRD